MENENLPERKNIPSVLHDSISHSLIERCIECGLYLLEDGTDYFIEKAFKKYKQYNASEVIFEYAICGACAETMRKKMSVDSMRNLESYFVNNINPNNIGSTSDGIPACCVIKGTPSDELSEYQVMAHCTGKYLNKDLSFPMLISAAVAEELTELLSQSTKDELDDFVGRNFGIPPELSDLPITSRPILI